jgi:MscS family membrane protein
MNFWDKIYYGNTVLDYTICFGIILGAVLLAKVLFFISKHVLKAFTKRTKTNLDDIIVDQVEEPVIFGLILSAAAYAFNTLNYSVSPLTQEDKEAGITVEYSHTEHFIDGLMGFLVVINVAWLIARLVDALIVEYITPMTKRTNTDLDNQILPLLRKGLKLLIWVLGVLVGLNNAGFDVGAVLAGLGIGGLAFALAAQDTVKNFFGGIMILVDKPFKVGERIRVGAIDGTVKEIGIRSTRVQNQEGRIVTIPNSRFSDDAVENINLEPTRKVVTNLGLVYHTEPEQMRKAIEILEQITKENPDKIEANNEITFNRFDAYALNLQFVYFIKKEASIPAVQTDIHLLIHERFRKAGIEMAFPTQTVIQAATGSKQVAVGSMQ